MSSQDSAAIVRRLMDAIKREDLDTVRELARSDYEFHTTSALPGAGVHRGLESVMAFNRQFNDTWETFEVKEERVISTADGRDPGPRESEGRASGAALETSVSYVHDLRDGRIARTRVFFEHDAALRAAGFADGGQANGDASS